MSDPCGGAAGDSPGYRVAAVVAVLEEAATVRPDVARLVEDARTHRPEGPWDGCVACGWHWPCPTYFRARDGLIRSGVPPQEWVRV